MNLYTATYYRLEVWQLGLTILDFKAVAGLQDFFLSTSPLYNLSRHISYILKPYTTHNDQHCKNLKEFSKFICNIAIEDDEEMVSFDVTSLYTNKRINDSIWIIKEHLKNHASFNKRTYLSAAHIVDLRELLLSKTNFTFENSFYTQTDWVGMGTPTYSIVAEIFIQTFESTAITTHQHKPRIWERHVNNIFAIIKKQHIHELLNHLNNLHTNIKFTIETEQDSTQSFLDTLLKRHPDKSISVNIYRKPTHTDQYLHFTSHHNYKAKQSVITTLFERAQTAVSNKKEVKNEEDHLRTVLHSNGYQPSFINKSLATISRNKTQEETTSEPVKRINLPYIQNICKTIRRILYNYNNHGTFYTQSTLRQLLSKPKDSVPPQKQNNVVYNWNCNNCEATYVGETKRSLEQRAKEHQRAAKNRQTRQNEIADRCWKSDHTFDWNTQKILDHVPHSTTRLAKESLHSALNPDHINKISYKLPEIWLPNVKPSRGSKLPTTYAQSPQMSSQRSAQVFSLRPALNWLIYKLSHTSHSSWLKMEEKTSETLHNQNQPGSRIEKLQNNYTFSSFTITCIYYTLWNTWSYSLDLGQRSLMVLFKLS